MADKEYAYNFKMVLRYTGGIKIITNSQSLSVLTLLLSSDMNLTDIANRIGFPKTSILATLNRLESEQLIKSFEDPNDSRSVLYTSTCIPIYSSGHVKDWDDAMLIKARSDVAQEDANPNRDAIIFYASNLNAHNICFHPFLLGLGATIGTYIQQTMFEEPEKWSREAFEKMFGAKITGMTMDNRLSFTIKSEKAELMELAYIGYVLLGTFMHLAYVNNSMKYQRDARVIKINDNEYLFETYGSGINQQILEMTECDKRDWKFYSLLDKFAVIKNGVGSHLVITNDIMLQILQCIEKGPKTVNEISMEMSARPVTIHASMKKLQELHLVKPTDESDTRNVKYELSSRFILSGDNMEAKYLPGNTAEMVQKFMDGEISLFDLISELNYFILCSAGIQFLSLMDETGSKLATGFIEDNPGITAEDFLKISCRLYINRSHKVRLKSMVPVVYEVYCPEVAPEDFEGLVSYFKNMVMTGLKMLTGFDYPVTIERAETDEGFEKE